MKVIFGIAILTAKDIDALNARISGLEDATKTNEQSVAQQGKALNRNREKPLTDFRASSLRLWTSSAGTFR